MSGRLPAWVEYCSYVAVALGAVLPALLSPGHVIGDGVDLFGTFWFYWWIQDCVSHLRSPGFTDLMFFPLGKDIFAHTGNNFLDAVVSLPIQKIFGFPSYEPWWVATLLLGNGLTFRPLAREVLGRPLAAWGATLLWMCCPYILFECMTGRFTQAMLWFLPLAVLHFIRIGQKPGWRDAVLAGVYTALQAYTYWFMGYFMALAFAWLAALALWRSEKRKVLLTGYGIAGLSCLLLVAPAGYAMARAASAGGVPGLSKQPFSWEMLTRGPAALGNNVAADLHGYGLLESTGQPMLAYVVWGGGLIAALLYGRERRRWMGLAAATMLIAIGPVWAGPGPRLVLPWYMAAYHLLPFFDRLWFPYRALSVVFLGLTLGIGFVMARFEDRLVGLGRPMLGALLPVLLAAGTMLEQAPNLAYPLLHRSFVPPMLYTWLHDQTGAIIELPMGLSRVSVAWQPVHQRPVWGGMGENASLLWPVGMGKRNNNTFIRFMRNATRDPVLTADDTFNSHELDSLLKEGFRWVVLDRSYVDAEVYNWGFVRREGPESADKAVFLATDLLTERLGPALAADGPLLLWDLKPDQPRTELPSVIAATPGRLATRSWTVGDRPQYETRLLELGRLEDRPAPGAGASREKPKGGEPGRPGPSTGSKAGHQGGKR